MKCTKEFDISVVEIFILKLNTVLLFVFEVIESGCVTVFSVS